MPHGCVFNPSWMDKGDFKGWVLPVEKNKYAAFCKPCATEINIESMGVQALKSHMRGTEHKLRDGTSAAGSKGSSKIPRFF